MHTHTYTHACTLEHTKTLSTHTYIQPGISKCKTIKIVPMILILHDHAQSKFFARVVGYTGSPVSNVIKRERVRTSKKGVNIA